MKKVLLFDEYCKCCEKKKFLKDFFGNDFSLIEEKFNEDWRYDFIGEMLQSHNIDSLIAKLKQYVADDVEYNKITSDDKTNLEIKCKNKDRKIEILLNEHFKNILDYFNYYITYNDDDTLYIEPVYTTDATDIIFNENKGICFHITNKRNYNFIMKKGLRCRNAEYRCYPEKIFLYSTSDFSTIDEQLSELADSLGLKQYVVFKINLNRLNNIKIYKDTAMNIKNCYFTYENIPASLLSVYKMI